MLPDSPRKATNPEDVSRVATKTSFRLFFCRCTRSKSSGHAKTNRSVRVDSSLAVLFYRDDALVGQREHVEKGVSCNISRVHRRVGELLEINPCLALVRTSPDCARGCGASHGVSEEFLAVVIKLKADRSTNVNGRVKPLGIADTV